MNNWIPTSERSIYTHRLITCAGCHRDKFVFQGRNRVKIYCE